MAEDLSEMKSGLEVSLFITDYMTGTLSGTPDEIYSAAKNEYNTRNEAFEFLSEIDDQMSSGGSQQFRLLKRPVLYIPHFQRA
jgi:hypothetical protein